MLVLKLFIYLRYHIPMVLLVRTGISKLLPYAAVQTRVQFSYEVDLTYQKVMNFEMSKVATDWVD